MNIEKIFDALVDVAECGKEDSYEILHAISVISSVLVSHITVEPIGIVVINNDFSDRETNLLSENLKIIGGEYGEQLL